MADHQIQTHDGVQLNLKSPTVAAILAFLFPGAGHAYQGRNFKAITSSLCILGLFFGGLWIGDGKVVYSSWTQEDFRWQYGLQAAVGLPAAPAALQAHWMKKYGRTFAGTSYMARPSNMNMLDRWHKDSSAGFDLGTLYTMIAGILNILVIFDAYAGPLPPPKQKSKSKDENETSKTAA